MAMVIIGHRGARGLAPENTLASIKKCLDLKDRGINKLEIDVRVTADGIAVLHHDRLLKDRSRNILDLRSHTFEELRRHKPDLTTLQEAFTLIDKQQIVYLEVKPGEDTGPIAEQIKQYIGDDKRSEVLFLGSKSQKTLAELHREFPLLPIIVIEPWSGIRATYRARKLGTRYLSMNYLWLWSGFIRLMHRRGYLLYAYTVNDKKLAKKWQKYGLAGICTDYPNLFAEKK